MIENVNLGEIEVTIEGNVGDDGVRLSVPEVGTVYATAHQVDRLRNVLGRLIPNEVVRVDADSTSETLSEYLARRGFSDPQSAPVPNLNEGLALVAAALTHGAGTSPAVVKRTATEWLA